MIDIANIVPLAASVLGIAPTTLLFGIIMVNQGAKVLGRVIPADKKGVLGAVRKVARVLGADPSSRVTKGVTIGDAAKAVVEASIVSKIKK